MNVGIYRILSQYPLVLFLWMSFSQADDFDLKVTIDPKEAVSGDMITFYCDFTIANPDTNDLAMVIWERTSGERILVYNHEQVAKGQEPYEVHEPYDEEEKQLSFQYKSEVDGQSETRRRHILRMRVSNCDRATYICTVLRQGDYVEASKQATLEIEPTLPNPVLKMMLDGEEHEGFVYRENTTKAVVTCTVKDSSVQPVLTLTMQQSGGDPVTLPATPSVTELDGCLHNGVVQSTEQKVEAGVETAFKCEVNYGGTRKESRCGITFSKTSPNTGGAAQAGLHIGLPIAIVVVLLVVVLVILIIWRQRRKRRKQGQDERNNVQPALIQKNQTGAARSSEEKPMRAAVV